MASAVPRLLRHDITKQWARNPAGWSPHELLAGGSSVFLESSPLTVKRDTSRFFMYEEHGNERVKLKDDNGPTQIVLQQSPSQLADLLCNEEGHYHYWTSPVADVAPGLLKRLQGYESLYDNDQRQLLDPRGPSLWMGSSGSATQAHYDVADNVLVQLFGTKRVRCYHPEAAWALHVFPDAHPRARKSQVNFDEPDHARFPHFSSLPSPVLDIVLKPGDALQIPAFWFHHVENGRIPGLENDCKQLSSDPDPENTIDGPSVSLNIFALSVPMLVAQKIFMDASRPFGFLAAAAAAAPGGHESTDKVAAEHHYQFTVAALRALGWALLKGLGVQGPPDTFIRTFLLDTRYAPLTYGLTPKHTRGDSGGQEEERRKLTASEEKDIAMCISRILPQFDSLREKQNVNGITMLVACHLLELWAVELVGAPAVADAWEAALFMDP